MQLLGKIGNEIPFQLKLNTNMEKKNKWRKKIEKIVSYFANQMMHKIARATTIALMANKIKKEKKPEK